jgi:tetratricopeptide (TPR) repeat protein
MDGIPALVCERGSVYGPSRFAQARWSRSKTGASTDGRNAKTDDMPRPTISLAMIARDRAHCIGKALASVRPFVDEIVVVDAGGSEDATQDIAKSFGARVIEWLPNDHPESFYLDSPARFSKHGVPGPYTGRHALADFSAPRNASFAACTGDFIFWIDSDDVVKNPEKISWVIEKLTEQKAEAAFLHYEYDFDAAGNCTVRQIRERIIRRADFESGKFKWVFPIHENIAGLKKGILFEEVVIAHNSSAQDAVTVDAGNLKVQVPRRDIIHFRNAKNLLVEMEKLQAQGEEIPWRTEYYLGVEMRAVDPERAVEHFTKYLSKSQWDEERAQARYFTGQIREMQMRTEEAWNWFAGAALDFPGNPAPWFGLARIALVRGNWKEIIEFSEKGWEQVGDDIIRKPSLVLNPYEWSYRAHLPYSRALLEIGRFEDSLVSCEKGLAVEPNCRFLNEHKKICLEQLSKKVEAAA